MKGVVVVEASETLAMMGWSRLVGWLVVGGNDERLDIVCVCVSTWSWSCLLIIHNFLAYKNSACPEIRQYDCASASFLPPNRIRDDTSVRKEETVHPILDAAKRLFP